MENRTTSLEYSLNSSVQTQEQQDFCKEDISHPPRIKAEVAFSAKTTMPVIGTKAPTDDLNIETSVVTCDSDKLHATNLDSNKIKSNLMHDDDTTNLSNILANSDVDQSIINLTNQMNQNFISAKADIDKYFKQKSIQENIIRVGESITVTESDMKELLLESDTEESGPMLRSNIDNV